jgi:SAM-dependent methyltransferase
MTNNYDSKFYNQIFGGSRDSADIVAPLICGHVNPKSVLEIGCGMATWSAAFLANGVKDVLAVDGPWVNVDSLQIEPRHFRHHDLREPFDPGRKFDLAVCMEVAEHLPESRAEDIVSVLTSHADSVLFAAAIPFQGGTDHINEKPQSYWAALFRDHGFKGYDIIRPEIWSNDRIEVWYRQNTIFYSSKEWDFKDKAIFDVVHPEMMSYYLSDWRGLFRVGRRLLSERFGRGFEVA